MGGIRSPNRAHAACAGAWAAPLGHRVGRRGDGGGRRERGRAEQPIADRRPAPDAHRRRTAAAAAPRARPAGRLCAVADRGRAGGGAGQARRRRAGHVHRPGARPGVGQGAVAAHTRHPAHPRLDRETDHDVGSLAHAQPDVQPGHPGGGRRNAGRGRARRRRRPFAHRAPARQSRRLPRPRTAHRSRRSGQEGDRRRDHQGDDRHQPLPRPWPRARLGRERHRGRQRHPDHPAHARRRAHRPHPAGRRARARPRPAGRAGVREAARARQVRGDHRTSRRPTPRCSAR